MNYLFIVAHADDFEISCAGFLMNRLKEGNKCHLTVLTSGDDKIRKLEQLDTIKLLNSKFNQNKILFTSEHLTFIDSKLKNNLSDIINYTEEKIKKLKIDVVITHYPDDTHKDHRSVSEAVSDASRKTSILYFESPNTQNFNPNYFVKLTQEDIDIKIKMLKFHKSQNTRNKNFYIDKVSATARFRGISIFENYAEAYSVGRIKL